jgi:hypothetical protein
MSKLQFPNNFSSGARPLLGFDALELPRSLKPGHWSFVISANSFVSSAQKLSS